MINEHILYEIKVKIIEEQYNFNLLNLLKLYYIDKK